MPTVSHADARAAEQEGMAALPHVARQAGPEQGDGGTGTVIRMHAGATDLDQLRA